MPDRRRHRGANPQDERLFGEEALPALRAASSDLNWLLTRGYAGKAAVKLVGDRHGLNRRQRIAVQRCSCSDESLRGRTERLIGSRDVEGRGLGLDGFNVLTTVETALGGGVILHARDGCFRDMASMHGTYRKVQETLPALHSIARVLGRLGVGPCTWYLDRPVANSGRLRAAMKGEAEASGWPCRVELVASPDRILRDGRDAVATADSGILDSGVPWVNLARTVVETEAAKAWILDLSGS